MANNKKLLTLKVIAVAVVFILVSVYVGYTRSDNRVTWAMSRAPLAEVQLINDEGETTTLTVKFVDVPSGRGENLFKSVGVSTIQNNILYYEYSREVTYLQNMREIKAPLDMAFFDVDGNLIKIFQTEVGTASYRPSVGPDRTSDRIPYSSILMAKEGFFAENSISEGTEAKLLRDTLKLLK